MAEECADATLAEFGVLCGVTVYCFYGLALVCEDFMVPALTVLCTRRNIPPATAGATLLAAGCNSPELVASIISIFVTRSSVGAGTIVGSAPFNIMGISGAAAIATGGFMLDGLLMAREVVVLSLTLVAFMLVLSDSRVYWYEALGLFLMYVAYVLLCVHWESVLVFLHLNKGERDDAEYTDADTLLARYQMSAIPPWKTTAEQPKREWNAIVAACARRRTAAADGRSPSRSRTGVLLKRARFYEYAPVGHAVLGVWQTRYVVLEAPSLGMLRFMQIDGATGQPASKQYSVPLKSVRAVELCEDGTELKIVTAEKQRDRSKTLAAQPAERPALKRWLSGDGMSISAGGQRDKEASRRWAALSMANKLVMRASHAKAHTFNIKPSSAPGTEHTYTFRALPGPTVLSELQEWFDTLVLNMDSVLAAGEGTEEIPTVAEIAAISSNDDEEDYSFHYFELPPGSLMSKLLFILTWPVAASMHRLTPDVRSTGREDWYPITLLVSLVWLVFYGTAMTTTLDRIGCIIDFPSTVMGLTLGAIGTSFPNLYASVLAAKQGQAEMAIVQAFASNVFNICIALGLLWIFQTSAGSCDDMWCKGCYVPTALEHACHAHEPPTDETSENSLPGSLSGTVIFTAFCIVIFVISMLLGRGRIGPIPAYGFIVLYALYAAYEVLAQRDVVPTVCVWGSCI
ncbi:hypothetical protein AB1Y20_001513 [Prymnesium parvum]|uniref:PH domain-containing protein n=1 Tax=Prymnesium parvum TaxID=97485 RepID=A0AB34K7Z4_PRYPA